MRPPPHTGGVSEEVQALLCVLCPDCDALRPTDSSLLSTHQLGRSAGSEGGASLQTFSGEFQRSRTHKSGWKCTNSSSWSRRARLSCFTPCLHVSPHLLTFGLFLQQSAEDVSQFDSKFTSQTPVDSPDDSTLSESANQAFLVTSGNFPVFVYDILKKLFLLITRRTPVCLHKRCYLIQGLKLKLLMLTEKHQQHEATSAGWSSGTSNLNQSVISASRSLCHPPTHTWPCTNLCGLSL